MLSQESWIRIAALGALASLVGLLLAGDAGSWLLALGSMTLPGGPNGSGGSARRRRGAARLLPESLVVCLILGVTIWRLLPVGPRLLGWPVASVFMVLALGLLPFLLVLWGTLADFGADEEEEDSR